MVRIILLKEFIMNKRFLLTFALICTAAFTGCSSVGDKSANVAFVYLLTFVAALLLLLAYCFTKHRKDAWVIVLFTSISVVNCGYTFLAFSKTLEAALWGNRIAYLGSVCLPIAMIMIFLNLTETKYKLYFPAVLSAIGLAVFIIAASPGYSDIYYKEVTIKTINGATVLEKVYGELHKVYLYYLIVAFVTMIAIITRALIVKKLKSKLHAVFMFIAVLVNIWVWLLEQLVQIEFEMLSVSYIITELFLLAVSLMVYENNRQEVKELPNTVIEANPVQEEAPPVSEITKEQIEAFENGVETLTKAELAIFKMYTAGESTKSIMSELNIKENTLKYHNKNIYGKLGVKSRKQLILIYKHINNLTE